MRESKGFTLIELVVVVAIISVLAAVLVVVLNPLKQFQRARDAQRRNTLKQLQGLLERYYNDHDAYPSTGGLYYSSEPNNNASVDSTHSTDWIPGLAPTYLPSMPSDPIGGSSTSSNPACIGFKRAYLYRSDGAEYALFASCSIEASSTSDPKDIFYDATRQSNGGWVWKLCAGQTACSSW